ncbi:MAG: ATP-binding protein [Kofleriaceae bacterium]
MLPPGVTELAIDDTLQRVALGSATGLELVRPDALSPNATESDEETAPANGSSLEEKAEPAVVVNDGLLASEPEPEPEPESAAADAEPAEPEEPLPDAPLVRLDPVAVTPNATPNEIAQSIDLRVQLVGARVHVAIAEAWDAGRIAKPDIQKPPFFDEVHGLLRLLTGRAPAELSAAVNRQRATEDMTIAAERGRGGRLTPLDVLARDFQLSQIAVSILFTIVAPRLRGELARLYGILANDPGRPLVDEFLLGQILGAGHAHTIARELDGDRPLRRFGLVKVGPTDRPFASLTVDPLIARYIANQPVEGEPDQFMTLRNVDRDLDELQMPRAVIVKALRYLSTPRSKLAGDTAAEQRAEEPVRIVVRGRTGSGRHTLLTSLAARAGRSVGVIELSTVPREAGRLPQVLEAVLRRAMLRGLLPCVDGLELIGAEDPETKIQINAVLRQHPGPIAIRLPPDASPPLDPGYLMLDIPFRNERQRGESWALALERHQIDLPDASELAARYRVGPGIMERVAAEVSTRPDRPTEPSAWVRELDDAVRQHLENRLGQTATRVTRLAKWTDIVLPEDITDSLLELTARVRHRKTVYEKWGFDRSITTARGITALFQGAPGTGKTMVAGVIARDLGLELYRVDVSRITSKWIGETEKNLGALFDAAEDGQVMLLFDEADSLFAKRTEVKTSVDRYSNMEVNYLLQRLDSFEGIAILTTNFGNAIDPAFKRRLTYRMTFPFPDEEMREQLWKSMIPPQVPIGGEIDFASLSQRFRLSGGYIRNAALRAAFLAVEEGSALTHEHLERAIRMEFREIGKLAETGTLE